ncbi:hypothetical protein [Caproicibacter sp.]|uniref:hypothetical protein n=1 Tax=Caproicibacter sp. TaxID=2814884 RepID=UPI0039892A2C
MRSKRGFAFVAALLMNFALWGVLAFQAVPASAAEAKTGVGLSEHVLKAYQEGWEYQYGHYGQYIDGSRSTDCSGLVKSYLWWQGDDCDPDPGLISVAGSSTSMLASAKVKGSINLSDASTLPRIHGLILYSPGHVGVYVGGNKSVDNRCSGENMKYGKVIGGSYHWTKWFKLPQISYPENGFVTFEGDQYYYENGQYVVGTSRTIDGVTYTFDESGVMVSSEPDSAIQ